MDETTPPVLQIACSTATALPLSIFLLGDLLVINNFSNVNSVNSVNSFIDVARQFQQLSGFQQQINFTSLSI